MILDELHGLAKISASAVTGLRTLINYLSPPPLPRLPRSHAMLPSTDVSSIDRSVEPFVGEIDSGRRTNSGPIVATGMVGPFRARVDHVLRRDEPAGGAGRLSSDIVGLPIKRPAQTTRFGDGFSPPSPV